MLVMIWMLSSQASDRCYDLGYRQGRCGEMDYFGMDCNPEDKVSIPEECRNDPDKKRGILQGMKDTVWTIQKLRGN